MIDLLEDNQGAISSALKGHQNGDVELDDVFSLRIIAASLPLVLAGNYIVQFLETVEGGLLAAIGHVLADAEIGLVGVDIGGICGE